MTALISDCAPTGILAAILCTLAGLTLGYVWGKTKSPRPGGRGQ
jgi:hypothetical protein